MGRDFGGTDGDCSVVDDLMDSGEKGGVGATGLGVDPFEPVAGPIERSGLVKLC